jgi:hypothetical protein
MAILDTAAGRAADNRRGWVANNGRHPVERSSLRGGREAGLRRMQRCSPALIAMIKLTDVELPKMAANVEYIPHSARHPVPRPEPGLRTHASLVDKLVDAVSLRA